MKGYLLDTKNGSNYYFHVSDFFVKLLYAKIGNWTPKFKGKLAVILEDKDDEFLFTFNSGKKIYLDIGELAELLQASKLYFKDKPNTFTKYKKVFK